MVPKKRPSTRDRELTQTVLPEPVDCVVGDTLCRVRIWTEQEWDELDPAERPTVAERVPGLGWVGAVVRRDGR